MDRPADGTEILLAVAAVGRIAYQDTGRGEDCATAARRKAETPDVPPQVFKDIAVKSHAFIKALSFTFAFINPILIRSAKS